jgi:hypothetical protein
MADAFDAQINRWHRIPVPFAVMWAKVARPLLHAYRIAVEETSRTSVHVRVYEASIALLTRHYQAQVPKDFDEPSTRIHSLEMAKRNCGFRTVPRSDLRLRVKALWTTIGVRDVLIALAKGVEDNLRGLDVVTDQLREAWSGFVAFMLRSIERDAKVTMRIAESNGSNRQAAQATLLLLEAQYNSFSHQASRQQSGVNPSDILMKLLAEAESLEAMSKNIQYDRAVVYRKATDLRVDDQIWITKNFVIPANAIIDKWIALRGRLKEGFFADVSDSEKRDVVKALMDGMGGGRLGEYSI